MIRALIIDDEPACRLTLTSQLEEHCPQIQIIGSASSVAEGRSLIELEKPDLLFLDVEMPGENGFDLLSSFSDFSFKVIFVSAFSHFAIKAIRFAAIDYLLKPVQADELVAAVDKLDNKDIDMRKRYEVFLSHMQQSDSLKKKIVLKTTQGFEVLELKDIIRCEGDRNYTTFHFINRNSIVVSKTLKEFELLFTGFGFMRVHQSHLINLDHVKRYVKGRGGYAVMSDESAVEIARDKKDTFVCTLENLLTNPGI